MKLSEYFKNEDSRICKVGDSILVGMCTSPACMDFVIAKVIAHPSEPLIALMPLANGYNSHFRWLPRDSRLKDFKAEHGRYMEFDDKCTNTLKSGTIIGNGAGRLFIILKRDNLTWQRIPLDNQCGAYNIMCLDEELNAYNARELLGDLDLYYTCNIKIER